jgi:hypothetical protein
MFYLDLFRALDRHHVQYLLIGGLAVSLHGVERATMDVDITVAMTPENLAALTGMAEELGLLPVLPVPLQFLQNLDVLRRWHAERHLAAFALRTPELAGVTMDILLFPPVEFFTMLPNALVLDVAGVAVRIASIDDLIALKQAVGRPIDIADIEHLRRIQSS